MEVVHGAEIAICGQDVFRNVGPDKKVLRKMTGSVPAFGKDDVSGVCYSVVLQPSAAHPIEVAPCECTIIVGEAEEKQLMFHLAGQTIEVGCGDVMFVPRGLEWGVTNLDASQSACFFLQQWVDGGAS